uniref:BPL/LPL catalytic domain-containing protein n=1 Tax=Heterorhabditis bacteriophora TaxID=37862 RepID=A0A1I7XD14_HETBA
MEMVFLFYSMLFDTPGWYEFTNGVLLIWEGICAVSVTDVIQLYKIRNRSVISVVIKNTGVNTVILVAFSNVVYAFNLLFKSTYNYLGVSKLIFSIKISSNGYWQCVELQGTIGTNKAHFYYHAESPAKACLMIESILSNLNDTISDLVARFDPDPFRIADGERMKRRIGEWKILVEKYCRNGRIVLESNMPM